MSKHHKIDRTSLLAFGFAFILTVATFAQVMLSPKASADQITVRSLRLLTGGSGDGGSLAGGTVNHLFTFTLPVGGSVGSIMFQYCTTAANSVASPICIMPTDLVTSGATLGPESGATGFTLNNSTEGSPYLTRTAANVSPGQVVSYQLNNIVNPSAANETFFVRMYTYGTANATGAPIDSGTVAASTATAIELSGVMPESLIFCAGETVGLDIATETVVDCSTATPGIVTFDKLFSSTDTAMATSQMAASTNAGFGYSITVNGPTLTSDSNTITAMAAPVAGVRGTSQFGMNLALNTTLTADGFGLEPYITTLTDTYQRTIFPASNGTNYKAQATADYASPDVFKYADGNVVANSESGSVPYATDAQIYTVSYIANVPGSQAAGTYNTTLTYVCTPTY